MKTIKKPFTGLARKLLSIPVLTLLFAPVCSFAQTDNTAALQAQLNAGNVTLTAGATYYTTGLSVTHALNLNGATLIMTGASNACVKLTAAGASVTNGTIKGSWNPSLPINTSGPLGARTLADNCSITNLHITGIPNYGIIIGTFKNPVVSGNTLDNIGYIGVFYDSESNVAGGTFSNNVIDRSMLNPATVSQPAVAIRGSSTGTYYDTGWTITGNTFKMPVNPTASSSEGMELRNTTNSTVSNNIGIGGSIPISIVGCTGITVSGNKLSGAQMEGLEFASCINCTSTNDIITSSTGAGILLDGGAVACNGITFTNDQISGTTQECIHCYKNSQNITITGCTLVVSVTGTKAINLQSTSGVKIVNSTISGNNTAALAIMMDTCPGNLTITGGTISNFTNCVVTIYNATAGSATSNVIMTGTTVTGVPKRLTETLANGATASAIAVGQ